MVAPFTWAGCVEQLSRGICHQTTSSPQACCRTHYRRVLTVIGARANEPDKSKRHFDARAYVIDSPQVSTLPFDCILSDAMNRPGMFEFILAAPVRCPLCNGPVTEKTLG
jgi:hypothetical protein